MRTIELGEYASRSRRDIIRIIDKYFRDLDLDIEYEESYNKYQLIIEKEEFTDEDYALLSEALVEILIEFYLEDIIFKRLEEIYPRENIIPNIKMIEKIKMELRTSQLYLEEKMEIRHSLIDYLSENDYMDLNGYFIFRLSDYMYILDIAIDSVVSKIREERKLEDFLEMIQYIVNVQESKTEVLNLIIEDGDFKFRDIDNKEIGREIIAQIEEELKAVDGSKADVLLSSLIMMSPKRLVVHYIGDKRSLLIQAIVEIFKDRVSFCSGCNICKLDSGLEY